MVHDVTTFGKPTLPMFKDIRRITVYVLVCIPLFVITFLVTRQIQYAFEVKKAITTTRDLDVNVSVLQRLVAINEHSTKTFFLAFICLLMILCGIIIVLKATDDALSFTKERKVRYSLKTVYPGAVMAIAGCLLLTYSVYHSTHVNYTNALPEVKHQNLSQKSKTGGVTRQDSIITLKVSQNLQQDNGISPRSNSAEIKLDNTIGEISAGTAHEDRRAEWHARRFSESEVRWASELANRSIIHGNLPTRPERSKYLEIVENFGGSHSSVHWAFQLLLRADQGYQPTEAELKKYEMVVTEQLGGS